MKLLLHICCAPCTIYPLRSLRDQGVQVGGYFYNPNIHPYREYKKRRETLKEYARATQLEVTFDDRYELERFLTGTLPLGPERCRFCYTVRLEAAAQWAKANAWEAFSTTLLYSRFQKHDWIRSIGREMGERYQIPFYDQDFREGWNEGVEVSKALGLYRQPYCGCIFSEKERFAPNGLKTSTR